MLANLNSDPALEPSQPSTEDPILEGSKLPTIPDSVELENTTSTTSTRVFADSDYPEPYVEHVGFLTPAELIVKLKQESASNSPPKIDTPVGQDSLDPVITPTALSATEINVETQKALSDVNTAVASNLSPDGSYSFASTNPGRTDTSAKLEESSGGLVAFMKLDSADTPSVQTYWSLSGFRSESREWQDYPLAGFDPNSQINPALASLPKSPPAIEEVLPLKMKDSQGNEGYSFPRWSADGSRGVLFLQKTSELPPSVAYVLKMAESIARKEGSQGLATLTPIEMPARDPKFKGNVHGHLSPDGKIIFTYKDTKTYRVYDPLAAIDATREHRYAFGKKQGAWATLKSSWDAPNGYQPSRISMSEGFDPVKALANLWAK